MVPESKDADVKYKLVSGSIIAVLVLIALIALVAKGPPAIYLYTGPTPLNQAALGTSQLVILLRHEYPLTIPVESLEDLARYARGEHCLFIVVSPQVEISRSDAHAIVSYLRNCKHYALLIADESRYSNNLIEAFGAHTLVEGSIVLNASSKSPYPYAVFNLRGEVIEVRLDIASSLSTCPTLLGYVSNALILYPNKPPTLSRRACIATYEKRGSGTIIVVGDGSLFLNQVLTSSSGSKYRELILKLVSMLCNNDRACRIFVDAIHYKAISPIEVLRNPSIAKYVDPFSLVPALIAYVVHPATWLPPALELANRFVTFVFSNYATAALAALIAILISYAVAKRLLGSGRDVRLMPQLEYGSVFSTELHDAIARGRYAFTKEDFVNLYSLVDEALRSVLGISLSDPQCVDILAKYIGSERARRFVSTMNSYLAKARGERFLPLVLSWNRVVKRMLRESEEVLNALGSSIAERRAVRL